MEITKESLKSLYHGKTNKEAAKELGISVPTLLKMVKEAGIKKKGQGSHERKPKIKVVG